MPEGTQNTGSEARLLTDERFLRRVSYSYYEDGNSQEQIADAEFCSRQTISKALQKARDKGIVRISIVPDLHTGYLRNLQREVRIRLGLEDLVLVAGQNMNTIPSHSHVDEVTTNIAKAAAEYLDQLLTDADILAVSGGQSFMRPLVQYMTPARVLPHLQVVATIGFVEARTTSGDANLIAHDLAEAYGANHLWFPCPAFLPSQDMVEQTRKLPIVRDAYDMMIRANVMVMGLWTPHGYDDMVTRGILTREQVDQIASNRPVMDMNHWVFDSTGKCLNDSPELQPFPYFLSGLEIPRVRETIRNRNIKVIMLAGGSPSYVPSIRAALKAKLANLLITDHITAQLLLVDD
jgi:deoxyribonucleoside regulator